MIEPTYDAIIVGTGVAGCAAALSLPQGMRALLVDRAKPSSHRCCGGLLTADSLDALRDLGLALPDGVRVAPEPRYVRVHDLDSGREQSYRRDYVNLDRRLFDEWLLGRAGERAQVKRQTRFIGTAGDHSIVLGTHSGSVTVRAEWLVGADGANSSVRRRCLPHRPGPRIMVAIQAYLAFLRMPDTQDVLFASSLTDYYAWSVAKPEYVIVGCAFEDRARAHAAFEVILAWYRATLGLGDEVAPRSTRYLSRPRTRSELCPGEGNVLLVGEAAGLVSPSSGEGISFALASGAAAGRALAAPSPIRAYTPAFKGLARQVLRKRLKAAVIFSPSRRAWALRLPWYP